jgi:aldose 1-epimerase
MAATHNVASVPPSGFQIELVEGQQRAVVTEVGATLRGYRMGDWEVLDGFPADRMCSGGRGQPLVPWPNRLRDGRYEFGGTRHQLPLTEPERHNAIHGLVRWANWHVAEREPGRVVMEHLLHPSPGYPFSLHLAIEYALSPEPRGLEVRITATNVGSEPCPCGVGFHPYLRVGDSLDDARLVAPGRTWLPADERGIPVGQEAVVGTPYDFRRGRPLAGVVLDTAFADLERNGDGLARVVLIGRQRSVTLWMDSNFQYLMLFTGDTLAEPERRRGLAVEPMTCPPNAFQSGEGVRVLGPGDRLTARWGLAPSLA